MKKSSLFPAFLVAFFGFTMGGLSLYFMLERQDRIIEAHTLSRAHEVKDAIQREFLRSESVLRSIQGLFQSSNDVTREEFEIFCRSSIHKEIPFHLIEWQPKVLSTERELYERKAQKDGLSKYQFFEINEQGEEVKAKERKVHFPVYYTYSRDPKDQTFGLDLAFSPLRMQSKYEAMKLGRPVSSGIFKVILKGRKERQPGFAITYPIFNDPSIISSQSLKHLKGFIAIVLYIEEFFRPLTQPQNLKYFQFTVEDEKEDEKRIYSSSETSLKVLKYRQSIPYDVGGRNWNISVFPTQDFIKDQNIYLPWLVFVLIILLSTALSFYLFYRVAHQEKIRNFELTLQKRQRLESLGVLASGVSHEFNNILQCIGMAAENLKLSKSTDNKEEYLETILDFCFRGRGLVRQILGFARQDTGNLKNVMPSLEIKKTMDLIRNSLLKDVSFSVNVEEDGDSEMQMNPNHISQILINLCNNAAYAMQGSGHIEVTYYLSEKKRHLIVKDNGMGMSEEVALKAFDPFFSTKPVNEGTGLGLSVIYGIVKSYNGEIEVISKPGKGSEFRIRLPK